MAVVLADDRARTPPQVPEPGRLVAARRDKVAAVGAVRGIPNPHVVLERVGELPRRGVPQLGRPVAARRYQLPTVLGNESKRRSNKMASEFLYARHDALAFSRQTYQERFSRVGSSILAHVRGTW